MKNLSDGMLSKGIIEPAAGPWASPIVLVKKKDGSTRFCIDFRHVNKITKKDAQPLPRIDDTFDTLNSARWFSTLDLASGYWQVEVDSADGEKKGLHYSLWFVPVQSCALWTVQCSGNIPEADGAGAIRTTLGNLSCVH